jgi:hypothetical protein
MYENEVVKLTILGISLALNRASGPLFESSSFKFLGFRLFAVERSLKQSELPILHRTALASPSGNGEHHGRRPHLKCLNCASRYPVKRAWQGRKAICPYCGLKGRIVRNPNVGPQLK